LDYRDHLAEIGCGHQEEVADIAGNWLEGFWKERMNVGLVKHVEVEEGGCQAIIVVVGGEEIL